MEVIKFYERMGTRYIINALSGAQRSLFESLVGEDVVIDLAQCKLGPEGASILSEYYATLNFINSEDSYLDGILRSNCGRAKGTVSAYEKLFLRGVSSIDTFMGLVRTLPKHAKYCPDVSLSHILDKVTLILLIMSRPDIEFDIRDCASDIYDYVRDAWLLNAQHHDRYYELIPPDTVLREVDSDGYYGTRSYGFQREQSFIRNRTVLPWEFGNTRIITLEKDKPVSEEWRPVVEKCLDAFDQPYSARQPGKVLRNLLTFRE